MGKEGEVAGKLHYNARLLQNIVDKYLRPIEEAIERNEVNKEDAEICLKCTRKLIDTIARELHEIVANMIIDPTTEVFTSQAFEPFMEREIEMCRRNNLPLSLLFVDVDNLKQINDTCGHQAGDMVLREVARAIKKSIRKADAVFRCGGDEFVVVLHTSEKGARIVKKRILETLAKIGFISPDCNTKIIPSVLAKIGFISPDCNTKIIPSVSIGVAEIDCLSRDGLSRALETADKRMYEEKRKKKERGVATIVDGSL